MSTIIDVNPVTGIPKGVICMWSGALASIPTGWALCDGAGVTPDLRSKFIKGAAAGLGGGAAGGSATYSHADTAVAQHAAWTHANQGAHTHDAHTAQNTTSVSTELQAFIAPATHASAGGHTHDAHAALSHLVTQPSNHTSVEPVYYAVCFIMKS